MSEDIAIRVDGVSKSFKLPHEKQNTVKGLFVNIFNHRSYESQHVLNSVSFDIKKGEFFGIVGRNGSGKSTLLKLLAGIYEPNKGSIHINGKLTPFIELGVGFNPALTGRENVYLNGALLGFDRKEMNAMYNEIVEFAELERFMDQKLKNYSSGMQVRLAFSIAIRAKSDILLLDEVLAVGDEAFQRKCYEYFARLKKENTTVIFVSHDMDAVKNFCTRSILVDKGEIISEGNSTKIASLYSRLNNASGDKSNLQNTNKKWGSGEADIDKVSITSDGHPKKSIYKDEPLELRFTITANQDIDDLVAGVVLQNAQGGYAFATNTQVMEVLPPKLKSGHTYEVAFSMPANVYTDGTYTVSGAITNKDRTKIYSKVEEAGKFTVGGWSMKHAVAHPNHNINFKELK